MPSHYRRKIKDCRRRENFSKWSLCCIFSLNSWDFNVPIKASHFGCKKGGSLEVRLFSFPAEALHFVILRKIGSFAYPFFYHFPWGQHLLPSVLLQKHWKSLLLHVLWFPPFKVKLTIPNIILKTKKMAVLLSQNKSHIFSSESSLLINLSYFAQAHTVYLNKIFMTSYYLRIKLEVVLFSLGRFLLVKP